MSGSVEFCAGFAEDLAQAIASCPAEDALADHVPFCDVFESVDRSGLTELFTVVGAADPWSGEALRSADEVRLLPKVCVAALGAVDDLGLGELRRRWWRQLGRSGEPPAELGQAVRGLVVQCRAALANGWVVAWRERACDDRKTR